MRVIASRNVYHARIGTSQCIYSLARKPEQKALLKNLGLAVSGGHSRIFMEQGVRNTLIQGVRSNQDLNKMKDSNNQVNET